LTTPRDRISYGSHAFPFWGLQTGSGEPPPLPMLPIRIRTGRGAWSTAFDAAPDTGSTRTIIPMLLAESIGLVVGGAQEAIDAAAGDFQARPATGDLAIVDAHYPGVPVWEIHDLTIWVPVREDVVAIPVLGWDVLALFHICFDHKERRVEMRLHTP